MNYLTIDKGRESEYTGAISEFRSLLPIPVELPADTFLLPETVLQIKGATDAFPDIESLPKIDESDITWISEEEPNQLPV